MHRRSDSDSREVVGRCALLMALHAQQPGCAHCQQECPRQVQHLGARMLSFPSSIILHALGFQQPPAWRLLQTGSLKYKLMQGKHSCGARHAMQGLMCIAAVSTYFLLSTSFMFFSNLQAFLQPFHWSLWLGMLLTVAFCPLILLIVENLAVTGTLPLSWNIMEEW